MVNIANPVNAKILQIWSLLLLCLLYFPVFILVVYGFNEGSFALQWEGFSFRWYGLALSNSELLKALANSLLIATLSTFISVSLAFLYALWAHRSSQKRVAGAADSLMSLPLFIPEIVIAIGLLIVLVRVLKPISIGIGLPLDSVNSVILGHATLSLGYAALILRARFRGYDVQQEIAAQDLGADRWNIFKHIMLPELAPGLAAACCISFALSLDDFYVSYFLSVGGSSLQTLPLYIWSLQGRRAMTPEINVVSSLLLFIALLFFGLGVYLNRSAQSSELARKG